MSIGKNTSFTLILQQEGANKRFNIKVKTVPYEAVRSVWWCGVTSWTTLEPRSSRIINFFTFQNYTVADLFNSRILSSLHIHRGRERKQKRKRSFGWLQIGHPTKIEFPNILALTNFTTGFIFGTNRLIINCWLPTGHAPGSMNCFE
jgi:hypothetical protein